jgi:hypothetical protein
MTIPTTATSMPMEYSFPDPRRLQMPIASRQVMPTTFETLTDISSRSYKIGVPTMKMRSAISK